MKKKNYPAKKRGPKKKMPTYDSNLHADQLSKKICSVIENSFSKALKSFAKEVIKQYKSTLKA